ncbi:MAG: putative sulfate exporter family transporter [Dehalococcoidia bacterium]|nr:putative sulfate exporter family transporter [Dehalococcoidia bacterium]
MTVYAMPQVVAAAFSVSQVSGEVAILVKLGRVMFIGPVVLLTGLYMRLSGDRTQEINRSQLLPWFVIGFFLVLSLRSANVIPGSFVEPIGDVARIPTIWSMAG